MNLEKRIQAMEAAYVGVQVDAIRCFNREGILDSVTAKKKGEQMAMGKQQAQRMGIQTTEEVFLRLSDIFNCAHWDIQVTDNGFAAENKACRLCAAAKMVGVPSPCSLYCLNPMEGMVKGLDPECTYRVCETLWDGEKCRIEIDR